MPILLITKWNTDMLPSITEGIMQPFVVHSWVTSHGVSERAIILSLCQVQHASAYEVDLLFAFLSKILRKELWVLSHNIDNNNHLIPALHI